MCTPSLHGHPDCPPGFFLLKVVETVSAKTCGGPTLLSSPTLPALTGVRTQQGNCSP